MRLTDKTLSDKKEIHCSQQRKSEHEGKMLGIEELEKEFPFIEWGIFLSNIIGDSEGGAEFPRPEEKLMITSPGYLKAASDIIVRLMESEAGSEVLKHFIKWRLVDTVVPLLSNPFRQERSDLNNLLSGLKPR